MKGRLLKSFFSSGLQAVSVQVLGVLFLLVVAYYLDEEQFGIINWANAVAMFLTILLSFGLEQVVVRRIAASDTSDWAAAAFFTHTIIGSLLGLLVVTCLSFWLKDAKEGLVYLPYFFAAQGLLLIVMPLKQFLNAKHMFAPYGVIAIISNICKLGIAFFLVKGEVMSITNVGYTLIVCAAVELVLLLVYVFRKTSFRLNFKIIAYKKLLKEAAPQYFAVIFDTSLSRIDWILLGIISTYAATGGYSFAYRAYELGRLPIVVIAPVILNLFARALSPGKVFDEDKKTLVKRLFKVQIFLAMLLPLCINILWSPLLDTLFDGKYGSSNSIEFLMLSVCIPIHFMINLLWTLCFSARRYKRIATVTMIIAISNLVLNLVLIPYYGGMGAAISYLITTILQAALYYNTVKKRLVGLPLLSMIAFFAIATLLFFLSKEVDIHYMARVILVAVVYIFIVLLTGLVKKSDIKLLLQHLKK